MRYLFVLMAMIVVTATLPCLAQPDYQDYRNEGLAWMRGTGGGLISRIIAHPDGKRLIIAQANIQVFDLATGAVIKMIYGPDNAFTQCDLTSDGRLLATSGGGHMVMVWETSGWNVQWEKRAAREIHAVAISSDGRYVTLGMDDGYVEVWEWAENKVVGSFRLRTVDITDPSFVTKEVGFLPDSDTLIGMGLDGYITAWDISQKETLWEYTPAHSLAQPSNITFAPDGRHFSFCQMDNRIIQVDAHNGFDTSMVIRLTEYDGEALAYSPDGRHLAMASRMNEWIYIWETSDFSDRALTEADATFVRSELNEAMVSGFTYGTDGKHLYTGNFIIGDIAEINTESGETTRVLGEYRYLLRSMAWSPDGLLFAGLAHDVAFIHDASSEAQGRILAKLPLGRITYCDGMAFSPDQLHLAIGCTDSLRLWRVGAWDEGSKSIWVDTFAIRDILWSPDRRYVIAKTPRHIWMYDLIDDTTRIHFENDSINEDLAFTPDGRYLIGVGYDGIVRRWDVASGRLLDKLYDHEPGIPLRDIAMAREGNRFATASTDGEFIIWNTETMQPERRISQQGDVLVIDMTPDGSYMLSAGSNGPMTIWDASTGDSIGEYNEQPFPTVGITISPDGRYVAWSSFDGLYVYHARWKQSGVEHDKRSGADGLHLGAITPNPARDHAVLDVTIAGAAGRAVPLRIELYDERGERLVVVTDEIVEPGAHSARLETEGLPSGMYVVRVTSGDLNVSGTLHVMR